jgi:hypothetical protein
VPPPVSEALRRANGTGHCSGDKAHKFVQRIDIGKRRARGSNGTDIRAEVGVSRHPGRSVEAHALAYLACDGQSDTPPVLRHRLGIGIMFATTRSRIRSDTDIVNKRFRLGLYSFDLVALATYPR